MCFVLLPNQRLKLTEITVDDFAARQYKRIETKSEYVRATDYMEQALRRRGLAQYVRPHKEYSVEEF